MPTEIADRPARIRPGPGLFAAGGVVGGTLASTCCIVPLLLVSLGIGGAWIGNLTALEPYKPYFLSATALFLVTGFWHVYVRDRQDCPQGPHCARPVAGKITRSALWLGTLLALLAGTVSYWAPLFY